MKMPNTWGADDCIDDSNNCTNKSYNQQTDQDAPNDGGVTSWRRTESLIILIILFGQPLFVIGNKIFYWGMNLQSSDTWKAVLNKKGTQY